MFRKGYLLFVALLPFVPVSQADHWFWGVGASYNDLATSSTQNTAGYSFAGQSRYETLRTKNADAAGLDFSMGYEFVSKPSSWLSSQDLSLDLAYLLPAKIDGQRQEYQGGVAVSPETSAYNYNISSLSLLLNYQINFRFFNSKINPFVNVGAGLANAKFSNFQEGDYDVAAIDTINYPNTTKTNLAYDLGAGIYYDLSAKSRLSLGYAFENFGTLSANGSGTNDSGIVIPLGRFEQTLKMQQIYLRFTNKF